MYIKNKFKKIKNIYFNIFLKQKTFKKATTIKIKNKQYIVRLVLYICYVKKTREKKGFNFMYKIESDPSV
jgi:hypothetical protein